MAADPSTMTDPKRIRVLMQNALDRNEEGLARLCLRRIFELGGANHPDPLVRRLWQVVTAYEETLKIKLGRAQRETRLRKKIETKGPLVALADWATAKDVTPGFLAVMNAGMAEFTGDISFWNMPTVLTIALCRLLGHVWRDLASACLKAGGPD